MTPEEILKNHINAWTAEDDYKGNCYINAMQEYAKTVSEQRDKEIAILKSEIEKLKEENQIIYERGLSEGRKDARSNPF